MPIPVIELGPAETIMEYIRLVLEKRTEGTRSWLFRGHRAFGWDLLPKIDRPEYEEYRNTRKWTRRQHEERLFEEFKKRARPHIQIEPQDKWEWLAVAQHHGLATRLLDWTVNPLAALYFAIEDDGSNDDSAVWCYNHRGKDRQSVGKNLPFKLTEIIEFRPAHVSPRITVQGGCFTSIPNLDWVDQLTPEGNFPGDLRRIRVPAGKRSDFRDELRKIGIDRATLFPDLDGIAFSLNRQYT